MRVIKYAQVIIVLAIFLPVAWWYRTNHKFELAPLTQTIPPSVKKKPATAKKTPPKTATAPAPAPIPAPTSGPYKDGSFTSGVVDASYGNVQVRITVGGGWLTDLTFLQRPQGSGTTDSINSQATPMLRAQALQAQSANVNGVTGASFTSSAFKTALSQVIGQARK